MPKWMNVTKDKGASLFPTHIIIDGDLCAMPSYYPAYSPQQQRKFVIPQIYIALISSVGLCALLALSFAYL